MAQRVYLETSIISYLAARPSRDLVTAARQPLTHEWWVRRRAAFEVCASELVLAEAAAGDPDAAERRAQLIRDIANAEFRPKVEKACRDNGFEPPVLCTPDELMGG